MRKKIIAIILLIEIVIMSIGSDLNIEGLKVYAKQHSKIEGKYAYTYDDATDKLYVGFSYNGKNYTAEFLKTGSGDAAQYHLGDDANGYLPGTNINYSTISYWYADLGTPKESWNKSEVESYFGITVVEPEPEPEPDPTTPSKPGTLDPDHYGVYVFDAQGRLHVYYITDGSYSTYAQLDYTVLNTSDNTFTLSSSKYQNQTDLDTTINHYNNIQIKYKISISELEAMGVTIPDSIKNPTPSTPTTTTPTVVPSSTSGTNPTDPIAYLIDGAAGIFFALPKFGALLIGRVLKGVMNMFVGKSFWETDGLSVSKILFNEVDITNVNFFESSSDSTVSQIRHNVAIWYYAIRNIAAVALLVILIYVGIRMALSTIAEDRAKYRQMLQDWAVSLALLFVLHFIMIFVININNAFVEIFKNGAGTATDASEQFFNNALSWGFTEGIGNAFAYLFLVGMTFIFLLSYIKRMITIGFLIVIAPLVTVTYSIDKMGDSKSQALNSWFKEFVYNILIQPFQCIGYIVLAKTAVDLLNGTGGSNATLKDALIAIMLLFFVFQSEKIIKHIFHFDSKTMAETVGGAIFATTALRTLSKTKDSKSSGGSGGGDNKYEDNFKKAKTNPKNLQSADISSSSGDSFSSGQSTVSARVQSAYDAGKATKQKASNAVGSALGKITNSDNILIKGARSYAGFSAKVLGSLVGGALAGGATGDIKNMATFTTAFGNKATEMSRNLSKFGNKHSLAKAYNDYASMYANENPNLTPQEVNERVRQRAFDLMNDNVDPSELNENDMALKQALSSLENNYKDEGKGEEARYEAFAKDFSDIEDGKYGEATFTRTYTADKENQEKMKKPMGSNIPYDRNKGKSGEYGDNKPSPTGEKGKPGTGSQPRTSTVPTNRQAENTGKGGYYNEDGTYHMTEEEERAWRQLNQEDGYNNKNPKNK